MRAVNLIPAEARRGGGAGRSGANVWFVLGGLGAAVVAMAAFVVMGNTVSQRRAELARLKAQTAALTQRASARQQQPNLAATSAQRLQTVAQLAGARFNWERTMRQLAQALPSDVWLSSFVGTVKPGVQVGAGATGAGGGAPVGPASNQPQGPSIQLSGCTTNQAEVARVLARLRLLEGVDQVTLSSSEKNDTASGAGSSGAAAGGSNDCRNGSTRFPKFELTVAFK
jgi:Tfp pilus assembly protein PilN